MLLSWVTGSISSGNLFAFDVINSKVHGIVGDDIVTIGGKFKAKTLSHHTQLIIVVCEYAKNLDAFR